MIKYSGSDYYHGTIYCLAIVIFILAVYFFRMNRKENNDTNEMVAKE